MSRSRTFDTQKAIVILALFFSVFTSNVLYAQNSCSLYFTDKKPTKKLSPEVDLAPFESHPIFKFAKSIKTSVQLSFRAIGNRQEITNKIESGHVGESLQGQFVKNLLEKIFNVSEKGTVISFDVRDIYEVGAPKTHLESILPMHLLKPVTRWKTKYKNRSEVRNAFNISSDRKIVHIYIRGTFFPYGKTAHNQGLTRFIKELRQAGLFDILIVSLGNGQKKDHYDPEVREFGLSDVNYVDSLKEHLTKKNLGDLPPDSVVYNDTLGMMPMIHQMSNLAIIGGAINFYESAQVGTPTIAYTGHKNQFGIGGQIDPAQLPVYEKETKALTNEIPWFQSVKWDQRKSYDLKKIYKQLEDPEGNNQLYYESNYYIQKMNELLTALHNQIKSQI